MVAGSFALISTARRSEITVPAEPVRAIHHLALPPILKEGLGDSDFRVLDVLLQQGPMPINALGAKVNLNPGSVSVAVDRLYKKGLVSRVESESDRRVRIVSLTQTGRRVIRSNLSPTHRSRETCISGCLAPGTAPDGRSA